MTPTTLRAIKGSIRKWVKIRNGTGKDEGPDNCPLCKLFYAKKCKGCPVSAVTGQIECLGSPYEVWSDFPLNENISSSRCIAIAEAEILFLKTLLPKRAR